MRIGSELPPHRTSSVNNLLASMLSRKGIQLWQGCPCVRPHAEDIGYECASWSPSSQTWEASLRGRKLKTSPVKKIHKRRIHWSQGNNNRAFAVESPLKEESFQPSVRVSGGGAKQLCDGGNDDLSLVSRSSTGNPAGTTDEFTGLLENLNRGLVTVDDGYIGESEDPISESINRKFGVVSKDENRNNGMPRIYLRAPAHVPTVDKDDSDTSSVQNSEQAGNEIADGIVQGVQTGTPDKEELDLFQKFSMARAAGKLLLKDQVEKDGDSEEFEIEEEQDERDCYCPKMGDYVMGVVVSGSHSKLDIEIGAAKLGHMLRKDVMPLDKCDVEKMSSELPHEQQHPISFVAPQAPATRVVRDAEVLGMAIEDSLPVDIGTVLTMEVRGTTASGRPILSARLVARKLAWERIIQLKEQNVLVEVLITQWNPAGLVSRIEGVRAFLPIYNLIQHSTASPIEHLKEYVGKNLQVKIVTADVENSNLVVSEKLAWMAKHIQPGVLVEGIVNEIHPYGVQIQIRNTDLSGILHISNIARAHIKDVRDVFTIGEEVKVMVVTSPIKNRIAFSTADLEIEDGLMLRDKQEVFRDAEKVAQAYKDAHHEEYPLEEEFVVDVEEPKMVIANWDWLDFSGGSKLV